MWINHIPREDAEGSLRQRLDELSDDQGRVDGVLLVHSLHPHTLEGHLSLYRNVLHHPGNEVPKWFLEVIGILVSRINGCDYCVVHHSQALARVLDDKDWAERFLNELDDPEQSKVFNDRDKAALAYAAKLTKTPSEVGQPDVAAMRDAGWSDHHILEINQVAAYVAYSNRTVLGLGVELEDWRR